MSEPFKKKYHLPPMSEDDFKRVTEINFRNMLDYFAEKFGSPILLDHFISTIALQLSLQPDLMESLVRRSFKDKTLPPGKDELIEIYYRSGYARRRILELVKVRGDRITKAITTEESNVHQHKFTNKELLMVMKMVNFFSEAGERMI